MATGSFDGVDFEIESQPVSGSAGALVSVRQIPGGDSAYIDVGGKTPKRPRWRIYAEDTDAWAALEAKRGVEGTLTTTAFGTHTAVLERLDFDYQNWDGVCNGFAEFVLVA